MTDSLKIGDHVFIGAPAPHKVHWEVVYISSGRSRSVYLRSPMSGRHTYERPEDLTLHTKGSPA